MYSKQMRIALFFFLCAVSAITTHCFQESDGQSHEQLPSQEGVLFPDQMKESNERLQRIEQELNQIEQKRNQFEQQFVQKLNQAEQELQELKQKCREAVEARPPRLKQSNVQTNQVEKEQDDRLQDLESRAQELCKKTQELKRKTAPWGRLEAIDRWLPSLILTVAISAFTATGAFYATKWYNKKYKKTVNKQVVAATVGFGTAVVIYLVVLSTSRQVSDSPA